jgi:hypothetical protein
MMDFLDSLTKKKKKLHTKFFFITFQKWLSTCHFRQGLLHEFPEALLVKAEGSSSKKLQPQPHTP